MNAWRGLTPELSRDAQRPSGVLHDSATSEAAKRSRLERIVRCAPAWGFGRVLDDSRRRASAAAYVSAGADCSPCGYRDALSKPTSGIVGSHRGFAGECSRTCSNSSGLSRKNLAVQPSELTISCSRTATSGESHSLSISSCRCSSSEIVLAHLTPELSRTA